MDTTFGKVDEVGAKDGAELGASDLSELSGANTTKARTTPSIDATTIAATPRISAFFVIFFCTSLSSSYCSTER